mgnify:CR=1 FL=1
MYESFYGFKEKPFHLTPSPNYFFASEVHKRAMSYLEYGVQSGEGFIVISGAIGTGKTTLANSLLDRLDRDNITCIQIVTPKLAPEDLLQTTATKLGLDAYKMSKAELLGEIEKALIELYQQGKRALLIVDEAQNLPSESVEELRMLSNFQMDGYPLIQSFLLGQNELNSIIQQADMEQFRQRIVASLNLRPLNKEEVTQYIEFRINQAHIEPEDKRVFSQAALDRIFEITNGVPRKINTLCDRILLFGFLQDSTFLTDQDVNTVSEEISAESNSYNPEPNQIDSQIKPDSIQQGRAVQFIDDLDYIQGMISEVRESLESSIEYKLKISKYLDNVIKRKIKQIKSDNLSDDVE